MNYLALDTSGRNLTVITCKNDKIDIYYDADCGVNHSVKVMPAIETALIKNCLELSDIDFFAVVVGAGSFTGIRIGVSTVKALCFATKKPCLSITSFDTIAYNKDSGKHLAIIDAKHGSYYVCGYDGDQVTYPPAFIDAKTLSELEKDYAFVSGEPIASVKTEVLSVAEGLYKAVEKKKTEISFDLDGITPLYIRKSQAEEGR